MNLLAVFFSLSRLVSVALGLSCNADVYMVRSAGQTHLISLRSSLRYPSLSFIPSLLLQHATRCPAHLEIAQMSKSISWMAIGVLTSPGRKNILTLRATAPSVHAT